MRPDRRQSPAEIRRAYYAAVFLRWFGVALPMALLVLLMQERGLDLFRIGLVMGAHSAAVIVLELPTGGLADAIGRKRTALLAQAIHLLSTVAFLLAFSLPAYLAAGLLMGAARALSSGALDAWFVDALLDHDPATDLQPPLAHAGTLTILGLALGSLAGGAIPSWLGAGLPADGTAILTPSALPFLASFVVQLGCMAVIALAVHEARPEPALDQASRGLAAVPAILADALRATRDNPVVLLIMTTTAVTGLAVAALETFWQPRFHELLGGASGAPPSVAFGLLMAGAFGVGVLGNLASIPLGRALGRRYGLVAAIGQLLGGVAVVALAGRTGLPTAVAAFWAAYLCNALTSSPVATLLNAEVPPRRRSATLSVVSLSAYLGALLGSVAFGALAERAGIPAVWTIAGALLAASSVAMLAVDRLRRAARAREAVA